MEEIVIALFDFSLVFRMLRSAELTHPSLG